MRDPHRQNRFWRLEDGVPPGYNRQTDFQRLKDSDPPLGSFILSRLGVMTEPYSPLRDDIVFLQEHFVEDERCV